MGQSSIWIIWGTKNEGAFILVDISCCHFNSDTVHTAITNGHMHPSDIVQILTLLTLMRCSWNQQNGVNLSGPCRVSGEKEMLRDRTWLAVSLLPGEWAPALYWYLALDWIFPVDSSQTQKFLQIYVGVFAWLNKEHSERGREIAPFSKCGQKQMVTFLFLDHTGFAWGS